MKLKSKNLLGLVLAALVCNAGSGMFVSASSSDSSDKSYAAVKDEISCPMTSDERAAEEKEVAAVLNGWMQKVEDGRKDDERSLPAPNWSKVPLHLNGKYYNGCTALELAFLHDNISLAERLIRLGSKESTSLLDMVVTSAPSGLNNSDLKTKKLIDKCKKWVNFC